MVSVLQFVRESEYPTTERQWQVIWVSVTLSIFTIVSVTNGPDVGTVVGSLIGGTFVTVLLGLITAGLVAVQRYDAKRRSQ